MKRLLIFLFLFPALVFAQQIKPISGVPHEVREAGNVTFITQLHYNGPERVFPVSGTTVVYKGEATFADILASGVVLTDAYWSENLYNSSDLNFLASGRDDLIMPASIGDSVDILLPYYNKVTSSGYAYIADSGSMDIGENDFTVCGWMDATNMPVTGNKYVVGKFSEGTAPAGMYGFRLAANTTFPLAHVKSTGGDAYIFGSDSAVSLGWFFYRMEVNQTIDSLRLYINEVYDGHDNFSGTFPAMDGKYKFYIGAANNSDGTVNAGNMYNAGIGDTWVVKRLLTSTEGADLMNNGYSETLDSSDIVAYYSMSNARCINDLSGNGHHLTVNGTYGANRTEGYSTYGSKQMLDRGYSLYRLLPDKPINLFVPHSWNGSPLASPSTVDGFEYIADVDGSSNYHNFADSKLRIHADAWDRSDADIWSDSARVATSFYDSNSTNDWHITELDQDNIDYWLNDDYKDICFVNGSLNSINQRNYLEDLFSYNNVLTGDNLRKVLLYTDDYDNMFTHFTREGAGVMMITSNHPSAYYYNGKTYVVYQGNDDDPYIMYYNHSSGLWSDPVKIGTNPLDNGDAHGYPSILIDYDGYIHVFYGAHVSKVEYAKSTNPEDISAWTDKVGPNDGEEDGDKGTYFQPIQLSDSTIYVFFRHENQTHDCQWGYKTTTDGGDTWSAYIDLFQETAYWRFVKGEGDVIHATGEGYMTSGYDRYNIYYARFNGTNWTKYDSTVLSPPVYQTVTDLKIYDSGDSVIAKSVCEVDSDNNIYVAFGEGENATGICTHTYKLLKYNEDWETIEIGATTTQTNNAVPALIIGDNGNHEIYLVEDGTTEYIGNNLVKWVSSDDGDTWDSDGVVIYGNVFGPSVVFNYHNEAKIVCGNYMSTITEWANKGFLYGNKGLIKNYNNKNW